MSNLVYYVATSLDGFIARKDGSFNDFAWDDRVVADFFSDLESFGTVLMGRKTYEVGLREGKTSPYPHLRQVVFSRTMKVSPDRAVELIQKNVPNFVRELKVTSEKPLWLCGGSDLASTLMDQDLIDRVIIKLNPLVLGSGIPLFQENINPYKLALSDMKKYDCGIVKLAYNVVSRNSE